LFKALGQMLPPPGAPRPTFTGATGLQGVQDEEPESLVMEPRKPRLVDQMKHTAKEKPDEVAKVINTLMIE
jgi:hypothetical protein